jgi:hypothetical protein
MAVVRKTKKVSRKNRNKKTRKYRNIQRGSGPWRIKNLFKRKPKPEKVSIANVIKPNPVAPEGPVKFGQSASKMPLPALPTTEHVRSVELRSQPGMRVFVGPTLQQETGVRARQKNLSNAFEQRVQKLTRRQIHAAQLAIPEVDALKQRFLTSEKATEHMAAREKVVFPTNPYGTVTLINP